jgi:tRNA-Thr(GGU) m(6)t(6)A37 methyltransferase TsaA
MNSVTYKPVGVIHTPFAQPKGTPIQPTAAKDVEGWIEVYEEYAGGLKDLDGFSHITLLFHFHLSKDTSLRVIPYMDSVERGVFATRAPRRPNAIGISTVRLLRVEKNILHIRDVDIVDGAPLLDIKPYVPRFDLREDIRAGWLEKRVKKLDKTRDDGRFTQ